MEVLGTRNKVPDLPDGKPEKVESSWYSTMQWTSMYSLDQEVEHAEADQDIKAVHTGAAEWRQKQGTLRQQNRGRVELLTLTHNHDELLLRQHTFNIHSSVCL